MKDMRISSYGNSQDYLSVEEKARKIEETNRRKNLPGRLEIIIGKIDIGVGITLIGTGTALEVLYSMNKESNHASSYYYIGLACFGIGILTSASGCLFYLAGKLRSWAHQFRKP